MSDSLKVKLCRSGIWQREGLVGYVFITSQDWDYYFDEYTEGEPDLGPDGLAYYALYGSSDDVATATSRSPTCTTEAEAMQRAEELVGLVKWLDSKQ